MLLYTKSELDKIKKERLNELIKFAGHPAHLAKMLNVTPASISYWIRRGYISVKYAKLVEKHPTLGEKFAAMYLLPDFEYLNKK